MALSREQEVELRHKRGRKPVDLVASMSRPQGRDVIWAAIRARRTFSRLDIEADTRINDRTIETYIRGLVRAGFLKAHKTRNDKGHVLATYELLRDVGVDAPRVTRKGEPVTHGFGRQAMWLAIRGLREFSYIELHAVASTPQHRVAAEEAKDYIKHLAQAGYLRLTKPAKPGTPGRYQLIPARNTGPKAPQIQRIQQVFDPNENRVVWPVRGDQ